MELGKIS